MSPSTHSRVSTSSSTGQTLVHLGTHPMEESPAQRALCPRSGTLGFRYQFRRGHHEGAGTGVTANNEVGKCTAAAGVINSSGLILTDLNALTDTEINARWVSNSTAGCTVD